MNYPVLKMGHFKKHANVIKIEMIFFKVSRQLSGIFEIVRKPIQIKELDIFIMRILNNSEDKCN